MPFFGNLLQAALQHHQAGRLAQAEQIYRQVLAKDPKNADALHFLGVIAAQGGRHDVAVDLIGRAAGLKPLDPDVFYNLGKALRAVGRLEESIAAYRRAVVLDPGSSEVRNNLGIALEADGQLDEAVNVFRQAAALQPSTPEAHNNLGSALRAAGKLDDAISAYRRAIAMRAGYADAHTNLALALLARGDFLAGWAKYEWRWQCRESAASRREFAQPLWDGRPLAGATLLLWAEQGFGDAVQFIRYLPLVAQRGGRIIIECREELRRLLQSTDGGCTVVTAGRPLPAFDLHCPLMSLPRIFGTRLETIPRQVPYLHADVAMATRWRERLAIDAGPLEVGLAWAGSKTNTKDRDRSMALSALAPLARVPNVRFHSLQKTEDASLLANAPAGLKLTDWTQELKDFADTAALISNLDLVISVDTAVAHLAGAMGKMTWVLLSSAPHWCWLVDREDSPWYPTARLFRQAGRGDWQSVVERVASALALLT